VIRVLRRLFGPNRDGLTGVWRKLHNEDLHHLYTETNIRRMRWAGHVVRMGRREMHTKFWLESVKGRNYLENCGIDGRVSG
jgi:hypothetical protein